MNQEEFMYLIEHPITTLQDVSNYCELLKELIKRDTPELKWTKEIRRFLNQLTADILNDARKVRLHPN